VQLDRALCYFLFISSRSATISLEGGAPSPPMTVSLTRTVPRQE
jgi:hypothetical protein